MTGHSSALLGWTWTDLSVLSSHLFGQASLGLIFAVNISCLLKFTSCCFVILFSKHRPSGPMLSISRNVRPSVCPSVRPSVCLFTFEVPFKCLFFFPLPEVGCPKFLEIQNPWGKVMERSGLRFEHFCLEVV